jgi:hypothetical protein
MNNTLSALMRARSEAQVLQKKAHNATAVKHADIRANLQIVATDARQLEASPKGLAESQDADAKQHLKNAATALDGAANDSKMIATANEADLKKASAKLRAQSTAALKHITRALAAERKGKPRG